MAVLVAIVAVLTVAASQRAPRALADLSGAAAAAIKAKSFAFTSRSVLSFSDGKPQVASETGVVDLARPGYRVQVDSGPGTAGFERIVFKHALYVRRVGTPGARSWIGVHLRPEATIAPTKGASSGISDPLGLLAVLSQSKHAVRLGTERVGGEATIHYRLRSDLRDFLRAQGQKLGASAGAATAVVDVWLDNSNRVRLVRRLFLLGGARHARLLVSTSFDSYGMPVRLPAPAGVTLSGTQPPASAVQDVVSSSVLGAVQVRSRHPSVPALHRQASK
jgi:hypothetical protein